MTELLLIIGIGGERVAIRAANVEAVVEIEGLTPVPRCAPHVAGLASLRSRVLTVIDCLASLELGLSERGGALQAIVVESDGHPYAFLVEDVEDVIELTGDIRPIRTALDEGWRRVATGMVEAGDDLLLLVDADALLAGPVAEAA